MRVEQVDFVSVPTCDSARAAAWYRDVLGLPVSEFTEAEIEMPNLKDSDGNVIILHRRYQPRVAR
jgi:catechol 2,3-dioxygenase-like lactoylglutathione lyase family enzyme